MRHEKFTTAPGLPVYGGLGAQCLDFIEVWAKSIMSKNSYLYYN